jgi:hypothetical protein
MLSCSEQIKLGEGILKGKISIGPLCPVETIPPQPQCLPTADTYKVWQTSVWNLNETTKIVNITPDLSGNFQFTLPTGEYIVDFEDLLKLRIQHSGLPAKIKINNRDSTKLDINIDTGIR